MNRTKLLFIAVLVLALLFGLVGLKYLTSISEDTSLRSEEGSSQKQVSEARPKGILKDSLDLSLSSRQKEAKNALQKAKETQAQLEGVKTVTGLQLKQQIDEDNHRTPPALLEFAETIAPHMEQALDDPKAAQKVFPFLEACARGGEAQQVAPSLQMMCAINAKRVGDAFPKEFGKRAQQLYTELPPAIRKTAEAYFDERF